MKISITGNGNKLEISIIVVWDSVKALLKALLPVLVAGATLFATPEVVQLLELLF